MGFLLRCPFHASALQASLKKEGRNVDVVHLGVSEEPYIVAWQNMETMQRLSKVEDNSQKNAHKQDRNA